MAIHDRCPPELLEAFMSEPAVARYADDLGLGGRRDTETDVSYALVRVLDLLQPAERFCGNCGATTRERLGKP